jgi:hypothetical protein
VTARVTSTAPSSSPTADCSRVWWPLPEPARRPRWRW